MSQDMSIHHFISQIDNKLQILEKDQKQLQPTNAQLDSMIHKLSQTSLQSSSSNLSISIAELNGRINKFQQLDKSPVPNLKNNVKKQATLVNQALKNHNGSKIHVKKNLIDVSKDVQLLITEYLDFESVLKLPKVSKEFLKNLKISPQLAKAKEAAAKAAEARLNALNGKQHKPTLDEEFREIIDNMDNTPNHKYCVIL